MSRDNLKYIDGLKGIACLIVALSHYAVAFYPSIYSNSINETHSVIDRIIYNSPLKVLFNGELGVCIFLVITGFLVGKKFLSTSNLRELFSYPIRRYLRLIAPIVVGNIVAFLLLVFHFNLNHEASEITHSTWWLASAWNFLPNLFHALSQAFFGAFISNLKYSEMYNPILWPIPLFYLGSLGVAGLSFFVHKKSMFIRIICYSTCIFLSIKTLFYPLIFGVLIADLVIHNKGKLQLHWIMSVVLLTIYFYFGSYPTMNTTSTIKETIFAILPTKLPFFVNPSYLYHSLSATSLFFLTASSVTWQSVFSKKFFVFFGSISYALFIFSVISIYSVSSFIFIQLSPALPYNTAAIITILSSFGILVLCSYVFTKYIETPLYQFLCHNPLYIFFKFKT